MLLLLQLTMSSCPCPAPLNVVPAPLNVFPALLNDVLAPPNCEDAVPAVNVGIAPAPINAPTVKDDPTNVVVKMEQMESEYLVIVPNKKYKKFVILVLDQTNDEDEDEPNTAIIPIHKIKVEPRMQPRQGIFLEVAAPFSASDIGSLASTTHPSVPASGAAVHRSIPAAVCQSIPASGAAVHQTILASGAAALPSTPASGAASLMSPQAPFPAGPLSVHPTLIAHGGVPPAGAASLLVGV